MRGVAIKKSLTSPSIGEHFGRIEIVTLGSPCSRCGRPVNVSTFADNVFVIGL